jgi:hypothetical protein
MEPVHELHSHPSRTLSSRLLLLWFRAVLLLLFITCLMLRNDAMLMQLLERMGGTCYQRKLHRGHRA